MNILKTTRRFTAPIVLLTALSVKPNEVSAAETNQVQTLGVVFGGRPSITQETKPKQQEEAELKIIDPEKITTDEARILLGELEKLQTENEGLVKALSFSGNLILLIIFVAFGLGYAIYLGVMDASKIVISKQKEDLLKLKEINEAINFSNGFRELKKSFIERVIRFAAEKTGLDITIDLPQVIETFNVEDSLREEGLIDELKELYGDRIINVTRPPLTSYSVINNDESNSEKKFKIFADRKYSQEPASMVFLLLQEFYRQKLIKEDSGLSPAEIQIQSMEFAVSETETFWKNAKPVFTPTGSGSTMAPYQIRKVDLALERGLDLFNKVLIPLLLKSKREEIKQWGDFLVEFRPFSTMFV